jgi:hypothetical protein
MLPHLRSTFPPVLAAAALAVLLAACGKEEPPKPAAAPAKTAAAAGKAPKQAAAARPEDMLPKARCPARGGAALPGPDIVGLKLGMSFDEALEHARCGVPDGVIGFQARWFQQMRTGATTLEKQGFTIQRGDTSDCDYRKIGDAQKCGLGRRVWDHVDELIHVATPGLDGRQTVGGIWRHQHWKVGQMPSRESVLKALREKYGPEGELVGQGRYETLSWRQDSAGRVLTKADRLFNQCHGPNARSGGSHTWREGCGLTITVDLLPPRDNPGLVERLYVGLMHQERLLHYGDAMQAELDRLDAARRKAEIDKASGAAPKL